MELVCFSRNLGRDVRLREEGEVLHTAELWILPGLIFLVDGAGPTAWSVGRVLAGPRRRARGRVLLSALLLGGWAETCSLVYKYSAPAEPINVALGL